VLVVEDNDATREVLALLGREGYEVILAVNGEEALEHLRAGPRPDLILLDMLMPVLDGWHFLGRLRQQGPQPPPPILVVTSTILTRQWAEGHGCCGFIRKPIEPEALLEEVRRCLE
jgi:CheY-like chemotaxis protein